MSQRAYYFGGRVYLILKNKSATNLIGSSTRTSNILMSCMSYSPTVTSSFVLCTLKGIFLNPNCSVFMLNMIMMKTFLSRFIKEKVLPSARLETGEAVDKHNILEKFKAVRDSHTDEH